MPVRVEIAGGGIAGLAAAASLARQGLQVRVHERRPELREEGGGIVLFENLLRALDILGATADATRNGDVKHHFEYSDHRGRPHATPGVNLAGGRYYYVSRYDLHRALLNAAREAGADIQPASAVRAARADGTMVLESGEEVRADLVIGADGVGSDLRTSLGTTVNVTWMAHYGIRVALDHPLPEAPAGHFYERWNGTLRMGYGRLNAATSAAFFSSPADGLSPDLKSLDVDRWVAAFPAQADIIRNVAELRPKVSPFSEVVCSRWSNGRVVLIGDAAHAMPPHRGQGAAMAVLDAVHLGRAIAREPALLRTEAGIRRILARWESEVRPVVRRTQRNAVMYCRAQSSWPRTLLWLRPWFFRAVSRSRRLDLSLLTDQAALKQATQR